MCGQLMSSAHAGHFTCTETTPRSAPVPCRLCPECTPWNYIVWNNKLLTFPAGNGEACHWPCSSSILPILVHHSRSALWSPAPRRCSTDSEDGACKVRLPCIAGHLLLRMESRSRLADSRKPARRSVATSICTDVIAAHPPAGRV